MFLLTICTNDKLPILTDKPVRPVLTRLLQTQMASGGGPVHAYIVMPDHLHVLLSSAKDVVQWVAWFKARVTFFAKKDGAPTRIWQKSFHDHGVRKTEHIEDILVYMRENPVKAGLVDRAEDWPWREGC